MKNTKKMYPLYLVIDCSGSMLEAVSPISTERRIDLAKRFPMALHDLYLESQDLVAHLGVSIHLFNRTLTEVLPLSDVTKIPKANFDWEPKRTDKTYFANLFDELAITVKRDKEASPSNVDLHNPAIVVFTDGVASNDETRGENRDGRLKARNRLLGVGGFNQPLQIVMCGIGSATLTFLQNYATHDDFAIKADPSKSIKEQMEWLVLKLKNTIRTSLIEKTGDEESWLSPGDVQHDRRFDDLWGGEDNE